MRRIRRIRIAVSEDFYNILEKQRQEISSKMSKRIGIPQSLTITSLTELMAANAKFPKLNIKAFKNVKQKRRCI